MIKKRFFLLAALALGSCKVTTEQLSSDVAMPAAYTDDRQDTSSIGLLPWNVFLEDTVLLNHVRAALNKNPELRKAALGNKLSAIELTAIRKNFLPIINAQLGGSTTRFGEYTMDGVGNDDTNRSETLPEDKHLPSPYREWFGGLTFSWELDIWRKLSNQRKAAAARYLASEEFTHAVTTWLIGAVATEYYELIGLDEEKRVLEENLKLQQLELEMVRIQKLGGNVNQLAVDQFEAQLLNTQGQLVDVEQRILQTQARINELTGEFPKDLSRTSISDYDTVSIVSVGNPHTLINSRPDIRQAELELVAARADVNAAKAAFYPSLGVSASAGLSSFDISKLLFSGSFVHSLAAGISAPIFQQRQIRALYEGANTRQRIALVNYEQSMLTGFHEVFSSLNGYENLRRQIELKQEEVQVLTRAFQNSHELFKVGYATYLDVITAQRRLLEVELEVTRLRKDKLKMRATLYRALGGGWNK